MGPLLTSWDFTDTTEWLRPVDLFLAIELLGAGLGADAVADPRAKTSSAPAVLEIGVWKGAWLIHVTESSDIVCGMGIDPYPGSPTLRQQVIERATSRGLGERISLVDTPDEVCSIHCGRSAHRPFSMIHIDGLHAEQQVTADLRFAAEHCARAGVIVVDDYLHPSYPGVASAMYQFLAERDYAMFLVTRNKAYICPVAHHHERHASTEQMLDASGLVWERYNGERSGPRYVQEPDVLGFRVALCLHNANDRLVLSGIPRPARVRAREQADRWIPDGIRDVLRPVRNRTKSIAAKR